MKVIEKFKKFMRGRYGNDELSMFLIKLYLFLFILNIIFNSHIISILELTIFVIIIYRFSSKNIYNRRKENTMYLNIKSKFLKPFKNMKRNFLDKEHIYKRCKHCKILMKLPVDSKIGWKIAKCPKCKKNTQMFVFKRQKIEIISKK